MNKGIKLFALSILFVSGLNAVAQNSNIESSIDNGIQTSIRQTENGEWKEAFATCRALDDAIRSYESSSGKSMPQLYYKVAKERFRMYRRINKPQQCGEQLARMFTASSNSKSAAIEEDFMMTRADYLQWIGKHDASEACYKAIVQKNIAGKNDNDVETAYKKLIEKSKASNIASYIRTVEKMYANWQDSIGAIKAASDLKALQDNYVKAQEEISDKDSTIGWQNAFMVILGIIVAALTAALLFLGGYLMKSLMQIKNLKKSLSFANDNNERKGSFIDRLGEFLNPSLDAIDGGNVKANTTALRKFLANIRKYMQIESSREEHYELTDTDIQSLCGKIVEKAKNDSHISIPVKVEIPRISFKTNNEALEEIISGVMAEMAENSKTESISIEFKKSGAKTGKFLITGLGMTLSDEDASNIFQPFTKVRDLTKSDGLRLPTCSLIAYKLNGNLHIDEAFSRGTRFILEMHT